MSFMVVRGYVRDAGGGTVTIVVDRETESYPGIGADVVLVTEDGAVDEDAIMAAARASNRATAHAQEQRLLDGMRSPDA